MNKHIAKAPRIGETRKQPCPNCPKPKNGKSPWTWQTLVNNGFIYRDLKWHCKECNKKYSAE